MKYSIRLTIAHFYERPAANSRHLIRVLPRTLWGRQKLTTHLLEIFPEPESRTEALDFFQNTTHSCAHRDQHDGQNAHAAYRE